MSWTDERIDLLKQLWGDGLSASQIAAQLGGVTRNAVIGKVHRLKLDSRLKASAPLEAVVAPRAVRPVLVETMPDEVPAPRVLPVQAPTVAVITPARRRAPPPSRPATLGATALKIEVEPDEQEEIVGRAAVPRSRRGGSDLAQPDARPAVGPHLQVAARRPAVGRVPLLCGNHAPDASPYCHNHARIAFQPVSERRRVR